MSTPTQFIAVLLRGKSYSMKEGDKFVRFTKGERVPVTADQKARLEETAVDWVTRLDDDNRPRGEHVQKFKFDQVPA